jgi:hypothetical protein
MVAYRFQFGNGMDGQDSMLGDGQWSAIALSTTTTSTNTFLPTSHALIAMVELYLHAFQHVSIGTNSGLT